MACAVSMSILPSYRRLYAYHPNHSMDDVPLRQGASMSRGCHQLCDDDKESHGRNPCVYFRVQFKGHNIRRGRGCLPGRFAVRAGGVASEGFGFAFFLSSVAPCAIRRQVPRTIWGIVPRSIRTPMSRSCATGVPHEYPISRLVCTISLELRYGRETASRT